MVDERTHQAAKVAAAQAGMTLSEWASTILVAAALNSGKIPAHAGE